MNATADRLEFAPPATPGLLRAFALAVLAHGLLVAALTFSVQWRRDAEIISAEAELWSTIPQAAAPKLQEAPLAPPVVKPKPIPVPVEADQPTKADIALAQEKRLQKQKQLELEQRDKQKQDKLKADQAKADKLKADKLKVDQAKQTALDKKKAEQEEKQLEAQRAKNLQRIAGLAGATGSPSATGTAIVATGPSASYGGRIRASIKPKIVFTEELVGNPTTEVLVRMSPDGTIVVVVSREGTIVDPKITKSSGVKEWDDAVIRAIVKTAVLPRDIDGSMPSSLILVFRPKD